MDKKIRKTTVSASAPISLFATIFILSILPANAGGTNAGNPFEIQKPAALYAQASTSPPVKKGAGKNTPNPHDLPDWFRKLEENHPYIFKMLTGLRAKGMADHTRRLHVRWRRQDSHDRIDIPGEEIPLDLVWVGNDELRVVTMKNRKFRIWRVTRDSVMPPVVNDLKKMPVLCSKNDGSSWAYAIPSELHVYRGKRTVKRFDIENDIGEFLGWDQGGPLLGEDDAVFKYHLTEPDASRERADLSADELEKRLNLLSKDGAAAVVPTSSGYSSLCLSRFTRDGVNQKGIYDKVGASDESTFGCWKDKKLILARIRPNGKGVAYILQDE